MSRRRRHLHAIKTHGGEIVASGFQLPIIIIIVDERRKDREKFNFSLSKFICQATYVFCGYDRCQSIWLDRRILNFDSGKCTFAQPFFARIHFNVCAECRATAVAIALCDTYAATLAINIFCRIEFNTK